MILICNYSSRIIPPIQSRCAIFRFSRLTDATIASRLQFIAKEEGVKLVQEGVNAILYLAEGDMRAAINLLQAAASTGQKVTDDVVYGISGRANPTTVRNMLVASREGRYRESLDIMKNLIYREGVSPHDLVRQIHREIPDIGLISERMMEVLERTAEAEFRISEGADGEVQITALLADVGMGN
jgi:replication factor C small subunit